MQKVLTAGQMREVDRLTTTRYGVPSIILMENAAQAVAQVITEKLGGSVKDRSILILCGKGNNGGDGAALARILAADGAKIRAVLIGKSGEAKGDAKANFDRLRGVSNVRFDDLEDIDRLVEQIAGHFEVLVDAVVGTGLSRPLDAKYAELLNGIDANLKIAIDIPSGILSDEAAASDRQFKAEATVTFTTPKPGNILPPASRFNGELFVVDIGSPAELIDEQPSQLFLAERSDAQKWLEKTAFSSDDYKNKRGHALIIAGSESYSGAAVLCGNAAMRSGVGLVTVVTPKSSNDPVMSRVLPEVMVRAVAETADGSISVAAFEEIGDLLEKADAIAIGCGLSQCASTKKFVEAVIANRRQPVVVDADALNLLSPFEAQDSDKSVRVPLILTPHEGEFMRLLGTSDKAAIEDRVAAVREFSQKHNAILVLKGERVLTGAPDGRIVVNPTGNSGLGKAGNGDTFAGILTGFAAQAVKFDIDIFETTVAAVYVAGLAGDIAEKKYGKRVMTASDVRECLSEAVATL